MNCICRSCIGAVYNIDAVAYELPPALLHRSHLGPCRVWTASNINAYETSQTMSFTSHLHYCSVQAAAIVSSIVAYKLILAVHPRRAISNNVAVIVNANTQPVFFACLDFIVKRIRW